jgi:prophage maintenance system killer protein
MEAIIRRPPFVDGNKRAGTASASYSLYTLGYDVDAEQRDLEGFAVSVAERDLEIAGIALWFESHSRRT